MVLCISIISSSDFQLIILMLCLKERKFACLQCPINLTFNFVPNFVSNIVSKL